MSTAGPLTALSKKELANMARRKGVRGWDSLNKEELVKALGRVSSAKTATKSAAKTTRSVAKPNKPVAKPKPVAKVLPKPATKSAAKVTKPASPPVRPTVRPPVNGDHRTPATSNGTPSASAKTANVTSARGTQPQAKSPTSEPAAKSSPPAPKPTGAQSENTTAKPTAAKPSGTKPLSAKPAAPATPKQEPPKTAAIVAKVPTPVGPTKDRIMMAVNDPYWLHVFWELSGQSIQRAEAALKQDWYGARLILRLYDVTSQDTTSTFETPLRDIPVETDGSDWYIHVAQPPRQYRVDLGYLSRRNDFFILARSNVVTPPKAGSSEVLDAGWNMDVKKAERIIAMSTGFESTGKPELREAFEERLKRPLGAPKETAFGTGATPPGSLKKFFFEIDARLVVEGRTDPTAHLTLGNDPIKLSPEGTFRMSFSLPDSRQIIPAVATSADGVEERTIVLAVERNTKYLDPLIHDQMNES